MLLIQCNRNAMQWANETPIVAELAKSFGVPIAERLLGDFRYDKESTINQ